MENLKKLVKAYSGDVRQCLVYWQLCHWAQGPLTAHTHTHTLSHAPAFYYVLLARHRAQFSYAIWNTTKVSLVTLLLVFINRARYTTCLADMWSVSCVFGCCELAYFLSLPFYYVVSVKLRTTHALPVPEVVLILLIACLVWLRSKTWRDSSIQVVLRFCHSLAPRPLSALFSLAHLSLTSRHSPRRTHALIPLVIC